MPFAKDKNLEVHAEPFQRQTAKAGEKLANKGGRFRMAHSLLPI